MPLFTLFKRSKKTHESQTSIISESPPPYRSPSKANPPAEGIPEAPKRPIEASDIPQWEWTTAQCQEWFFAVLVTKLGYMEPEAEIMAANLDGFGPNIYTRTIQKWKDILGEDQGEGIYTWILDKRHQKGAVPRRMKMAHGVRRGQGAFGQI
jgi:hypothetical protein